MYPWWPNGYLFYYRNPEVICFHRLPYKPCQFVEHSWHSHRQQSAFQIQWWTQWHNDQMVKIYQCTGIASPTTSFCQSCQPGSVHWIIPDDGSLDNSCCTLVRLRTSWLRECKLWANRATALSFKEIHVKSPLLCTCRINVDSMKMSDHVEFVAPQTSDLAETMAKRLLEGILLPWGWTHHDLPSLHELMQRSMEPFDSQRTGEVASPNEDYLYESR